MKISKYFTDKSKWTQGVNFRTADGLPLGSPEETMYLSDAQKSLVSCCCLLGAVKYCYAPWEQGDIMFKLSLQLGAQRHEPYVIVEFNDASGRTFEEVKDIVEAAGV